MTTTDQISSAEEKVSGTVVNGPLVISNQLSAKDWESGGSTDILNSSDKPQMTSMMKRSESLELNSLPSQTANIVFPVTGGSTDTNAKCIICFTEPKRAIFVHGKSGHQVSCYRCAEKVRRRLKYCPICRKKIDKVIVNHNA